MLNDVINNLYSFWDSYKIYLGWVPETLIVLVGVYLSAKIVRKFIDSLHNRSLTERNIYLNTLYYAIYTPIIFLVWFIGAIFIALILRRHFNNSAILFWIEPIQKVGLIITVSWFVWRFLSKGEENLVNPPDDRTPVNRTTAIAIGRLLRITLFSITSLLIIQSLGLEMGGIVTLGSAGTIVLGIAARDLLANFFGGLMIFTDRPFSVGDWIRSNEKDIEGEVEHIGWRLTRIRTFDKRPLYVPNSLFLTLTIENPQRMLNRRIRQIISIRYEDANKVVQLSNEIEAFIASHAEIDQNRIMFVTFNNFGPHSIDIIVYCFTKTTEWVKFMKVQQDIFANIMEIINTNGAALAVPRNHLSWDQEHAKEIETAATLSST